MYFGILDLNKTSSDAFVVCCTVDLLMILSFWNQGSLEADSSIRRRFTGELVALFSSDSKTRLTLVPIPSEIITDIKNKYLRVNLNVNLQIKQFAN